MARLIRGCAHGGIVLDLGGGAFLATALRQCGLEVVAVAPMTRPANSPLPAAGVPVVQNRLPDGCFHRGTFDVIVGKHVLEHERDPRVAVASMLEMLAPNGSLVIQVPNANSWQALLLAGAWEGFDIPRHPVSFDESSLERLLGSCGLVVAKNSTGSIIEAALCLATSFCPWLDPDIRQVRGLREHRIVEGLKDFLYCLIAVVVIPFILLELASDSGPAVVVEARRASDADPVTDRPLRADGSTNPMAEAAAPPQEPGR